MSTPLQLMRGFSIRLAAGSGGTEALQAQVKQVGSHLGQYVKQADSAIDMASVDLNTGVAAMQGADASFKAASKTMADIATDTDRRDEIGDLQRALGQMVSQLSDSMQTVQQAAQSIAGAARSPPATRTCPTAPSRPPAACSRPRPRWNS